MKQVIVGVFSCGAEDVQLVLREGSGGEFYCTPEKGAVARIKVGADSSWSDVISALLHEVFELQMTRLMCRYDPTTDYGRDHSSYLFVMTHPQFSNVCGRAAEFLTAVLPSVSKAYKKWHRK